MGGESHVRMSGEKDAILGQSKKYILYLEKEGNGLILS